jgi:hypothetical protein
MTTLEKAAQQALEALENGKRVRAGEGGTKYQPPLEDSAITALRAALAQQEEGRMEFNVQNTVCAACGSTNGAHSHDCPVAKAALAQQEQDTAVHMTHCNQGEWVGVCKYGEEDCPALAQQEQEQEPVAWQVHPFDYGIGYEGVYAMTQRPDQVKAWERKGWTVQPLFTHPPRRVWVSLTEEEIGDVFQVARNAKLGSANDNSRHRLSVVEIARAIEAALKEKNA